MFTFLCPYLIDPFTSSFLQNTSPSMCLIAYIFNCSFIHINYSVYVCNPQGISKPCPFIFIVCPSKLCSLVVHGGKKETRYGTTTKNIKQIPLSFKQTQEENLICEAAGKVSCAVCKMVMIAAYK